MGKVGHIRISGYLNREEFILDRVKGKLCLHLGCIGETGASSARKVKRIQHLLHYRIAQCAEFVVGVDHDKDTIDALKHSNDLGTLVYGDVENIKCIDLPCKTFDVIVAGDLIEHLSNPGRMLESVRSCMTRESSLLVSVPHAFGLPNYLRFICGRFREGPDHVACYNIYSLSNLLARYGFSVLEFHTAYESRSKEIINPLVFKVGATFLKVFPALGGSLLAVAKLCDRQAVE